MRFPVIRFFHYDRIFTGEVRGTLPVCMQKIGILCSALSFTCMLYTKSTLQDLTLDG